MRVLIVGATGFVGRHLLRECASRGDEVFATYRPGEEVPDLDANWLAVNVLDSESLDAAMQSAEPQGVLHLAGQASVAYAHENPVGTFRVNAEGTYRVLDSVRRGAREAQVLVVSSAEVYGPVNAEDLPVRESRPMNPQTPYGVSKAAAELAVDQAVRGWGLSVVRMRPFNHLGPGQRLGFVAPDFASQVAAVERGASEPVLRVGNLSGRRDFTDVRDIVRGYRDALIGRRPGGVYNLCSGVPTPIEEIVRFLISRSKEPIELVHDESRLRPVDVPEFRGDASLARQDFGWEPEIDLEQSLTEVLDEWRARSETVSQAD